MALLERDQVLGELAELVVRAREGRGSLVALGGEAGVGKTSVVRALGERLERVRFMVGHCDSLATPRPLGPLHDIALDPASGMAGPLSDGRARHAVFDAFLDELRSALRPGVVVLEDVHWADEATLDLIRFIGRRIADTHGVVILTYRDDEVGPSHPLTGVLGDLATARGLRRLPLTPLSVEAVRALAGEADVDPGRLHATTRGNPFFVTEVLAVGGDDLPQSVSDAVLARAARLGEGARRLVDAASVVPDRVEGRRQPAEPGAGARCVDRLPPAHLAGRRRPGRGGMARRPPERCPRSGGSGAGEGRGSGDAVGDRRTRLLALALR